MAEVDATAVLPARLADDQCDTLRKGAHTRRRLIRKRELSVRN
ncbi:MAG: hypothetical protein ACYTEM_07840 [Planctomycetota bacterium]